MSDIFTTETQRKDLENALLTLPMCLCALCGKKTLACQFLAPAGKVLNLTLSADHRVVDSVSNIFTTENTETQRKNLESGLLTLPLCLCVLCGKKNHSLVSS